MIKHLFHLSVFSLLFLLTDCTPYQQKPNQKQPFPSPGGKYILSVPIEEDPGDKHYYWRVTITDTNGKLLFKDDSTFVGNLNVYWYWDKDDRVWLKNSDNGYVYYWQHDSGGGWKRHEWESNNKQQPRPPAELFPD